MNIIEAHKINYIVKDKNIFHDLDITIPYNEFVTIVGKNGTGKSTLLKILSGEIITDSKVSIDNIEVNKFNIEEIMKRYAVISSYNEFFSRTVLEEILQDKRNVSVFEVNKVKKLLDDFNLLYLEKMTVQNLSYAENQIIALIKAIIKKPKLIVLDNAFSKLDIDKRKELYTYLKEFAVNNNITIISTTNNPEDLKFSDRVLLLKYGKIEFDGTYDNFIKEVDLNKEGLKYPWEVEISNKLMMYDLIDKDCFTIEELVGELCK